MLKDRKAASAHLSNVGRGTFVLISALWEAYCEALALEAATLLVQNSRSTDDLPVELKKQIARDLRDDKNHLSAWKLAGDGWKELAQERVSGIAAGTIFNTPKPANVDTLFQRSIGLVELSSFWVAPDSLRDENPCDLLKMFVQIRGAVAHGEHPRREVTKAEISGFYQTVSALVERTDDVVAAFINERTGLQLWTNRITTHEHS